MNYLLEIKAFYDLVQIRQLSTGQIALWYGLMNINNRCAWIEWFTVSNQMLELMTGLSRSGIQKARNSLKQMGLIDFRVNGTKATSYKMMTMLKSNQVSVEVGSQVGNQDGIQVSNQIGGTLNKQDKTKLNKKNNKKNFGEYENVKLDDEQYEKLMTEFPNDYEKRIQNLDDYIQSSGKKYKDHLATIRTWARKEGYKKPEKVEYKAIDTAGLTDEEYEKLLRERRKDV